MEKMVASQSLSISPIWMFGLGGVQDDEVICLLPIEANPTIDSDTQHSCLFGLREIKA